MVDWPGVIFLIFTLVTLVILTFFLYYVFKAEGCDRSPQFVCYNDWICEDGTGPTIPNVDNKDKVSCLLKSYYGDLTAEDTAGKCGGITNRPLNACDNAKADDKPSSDLASQSSGCACQSKGITTNGNNIIDSSACKSKATI
jgi:hypothetical protein